MGDTPGSVYCGICVYLLPPAIMQAFGVFSDQWLSGSDCQDITTTTHNQSNTECSSKLSEISWDAYVLEMVSGISLLITLFSTCGSICTDEENHTIHCVAVLGNFFYPIAGVLSIVGCAMFSTALTTASVGRDFYLCLFAGILVIIFTIIFCGLVCRKTSQDDSDSESGFIVHLQVTEVFVWSHSESG